MEPEVVNVIIIIMLAYLVYQLNDRDTKRLDQYLKTNDPELNHSDMKELYYRIRDGFIWGFIGILILTPSAQINMKIIPDNMAKWALMFVISTGFGILNTENKALV